MKDTLITAAIICLTISISSATTYNTAPPGTLVGNTSYYPDQSLPHSQAGMNDGYIAILKAGSMAVTTDQPFLMLTPPSKYQIMEIKATNCTVSPSGDVGGIYTATSKGGTAVVANTQTYTSLTSATAIQTLTNNFPNTSYTSSQLYLSLTTAGTGGPCDFYVKAIGLP